MEAWQDFQKYQILQKLKLFKKSKVIKKIINNIQKIQYNIMIFDIDKKSNNFQLMNILQLKWILQIKIQKKYYNKVLNNKIIKKMIINLIIKIFIDL